MRRAGRSALGAVIVVAVGLVTLVAWASRPEVPATSAGAQTFDPTLVRRGADLATLGDCIVCHTAPRGRAFAGGRAIETPFGTIYGTNITPDPQTGIGGWSEAAFVRAMRDGIDRQGNQLYPAFPYEHFRYAADDDLKAIYAFLMTRDPVIAQTPPNHLRFPLNIRPLVAIWKLLFLPRDTYAPVPTQSAEWNRGAYLVTGLGHCGACHTPRNVLGGEKRDRALSGGDAEGWHAPALDGSSPAAERWTADALYTYLRSGIAPRHDAAAGPMAPVTHNLATIPDQDVRAIAVYIASLAGGNAGESPTPGGGAAGGATGAPTPAGADTTRNAGATVYAGACASCHDTPREAFFQGARDLRLSSAVRTSTPSNAVRIILHGIVPPDGSRGVWMPAFEGALTDAQIGALLDYLRIEAHQPAWRDVDAALRDARTSGARS